MEFTTGGRLEVRVTPSDVGKRVSVRSLTGAAERHGRFTDTLGILTSWTGGVLRITRRDGGQVEIEEASMVAGKVVPPTPARRRGLPAADVTELQTVAARGWPPPESRRLGGWTLRAAGGFTARANSVLALGEPGVPLDQALEEVAAWYAGRGVPARMQIVVDEQALLDARLRDLGWLPEKHAVVRVGALAPLADRAPDARVLLHRQLDARWAGLYHRAGEGELTQAARAVLGGGPSVWFATVPDDEGRAAAIGRCVVDGRWAGFAAVEVAAAHRRQGLAQAVMGELARAALAEGASAAYLQVERDNAPARALYDKLGFADHHAYHYLRRPHVPAAGSGPDDGR